MSQKPSKSAAELENIIMTELLGYPECDGAGVVVVKQMGLSWDATLPGDGPRLNVECNARLSEINNQLRREFDLSASVFRSGLRKSHP